MRVTLPNVLAISEEINGNTLRQLAERDLVLDGELATFTRGRLQGLLFRPSGTADEIVVVANRRDASNNDRRVVFAPAASRENPNLSSGSWLLHPLLRTGPIDYDREIRAVHESWANAFFYVEEDRVVGTGGLRTPQIGAVHAVHAH